MGVCWCVGALAVGAPASALPPQVPHPTVNAWLPCPLVPADVLADTLLVGPPSSGPPSNGSGHASLASNGSFWVPSAAPAAQQAQAGMWRGMGPAAAAQPVASQPMPAQPAAPAPLGPGAPQGAVPQLATNAAAGATAYPPSSAPAAGPPALLPHVALATCSAAGAGTGWATQPAAAQAARMQQRSSGVAAAMAHASPAHLMARFSLKVRLARPGLLVLAATAACLLVILPRAARVVAARALCVPRASCPAQA